MTSPLSKKQQLYKAEKPKRKRCKQCKKFFVPERDFQPCCNYDCSAKYISVKENLNKHIEDGRKLRGKEARRKQREFNKNDKSKQLKLAQEVVNEYVRLRDKNKVCISCYTPNAKWDAGHYHSQGGNAAIRFNTLNIHKQCFKCNQILSANKDAYKPELIKKIGLKNFNKITAKRKDIAKYNIEYLHRLIKVFRMKIKLYKRKFR